MKPLRFSILILSLTTLCTAEMARGNSTGIIGQSGKLGTFCSSCHSGGVEPTVRFEGPTSAEPGAMLTFRFIVHSEAAAQTHGGLDVAASAGTLSSVAGQGTRLQANEVTHTAPKLNDSSGDAAFEFVWAAPTSPGTYTLFGAGNSVNRNGGSDGDRAKTATLMIDVSVAPPTATPTDIPPPTPTDLPPVATATATATEAPTPKLCAGDCGADGEVTVDELILGVNMALGTTPLTACSVFDANADGEVTIDEILRAVNSALNGCPV